jgi:hypothetical protein
MCIKAKCLVAEMCENEQVRLSAAVQRVSAVLALIRPGINVEWPISGLPQSVRRGQVSISLKIYSCNGFLR